MQGNRRYARFAPDEPRVWLSGDQVRCHGDVVNESYGGLGVLVDDALPFEVGQEILVDLEAGCFDARVTSVTPQTDGRFLIGLAWTVVKDGDTSTDPDEAP